MLLVLGTFAARRENTLDLPQQRYPESGCQPWHVSRRIVTAAVMFECPSSPLPGEEETYVYRSEEDITESFSSTGLLCHLGAGSLTAGDYPGPVPPGLLYTKGRTRPYRCCANHEAA
ncbi:hypothetical protein NQZ68_005797 [Dissostichus eleginoides]|nr:hypothetical protein NQZ68_005797 [Dissostichus eleginoides]